MRATRLGGALVGAVVLLAASLSPNPAQAAWEPEAADWPTFRHDSGHTGDASAATSAFTDGAGGFSRVKWETDIDYPVLSPPSVTDLDSDGTPEVVTSSSDVRVQLDQLEFSFNHKVEALEGDDGTVDWAQDEGDSFIFALGAHAGGIDADEFGEVVYFRGNPLTGFDDERLRARSHTGVTQWSYDDGDWSNLKQTVGILTGIHSDDVDTEAANDEVVAAVTQADLAVLPDQQEPGCPNEGAPAAKIEATNIKSFVHAVNGEGGSATESWQFTQPQGLVASTPIVTDLDGDGQSDVLLGWGTPEGVLLGECEVKVAVGPSAVDNRIFAIDGANPPNTLYEVEITETVGGETVDRPPAATPVVAGTTAGGDPIVVLLIPVPTSDEHDPDKNILLALNGRTGAELWRLDIAPATIAPLATADLGGDEQPEVIVQIADRLATFDNRTGADFWSQGTGRTRGIVYEAGRLLASTGVAIADLDSDGTQEIATILEGGPEPEDPDSELLIVNGADGSEEWRTAIAHDISTGGPVIADIDGDDDLLEIVVGTGFFTVTDNEDHTGTVVAFEPNAPDLVVDDFEVLGSELVNEAQTVRATVTNDGTRDVTGAVFRLRDDGADVENQTADLVAGASTTLDFTWTPATPGEHDLTVEADPDGAVRELVETNNEHSETFRVKAEPNAAFTFSPGAPAETDTVQFTDQSTDDRTIVAWDWSCTDGFTSSQQNPSHEFDDGGAYDCTLAVTDDDGLTDDVTKTVDVSHVAPIADFEFEEVTPHEVQFTDTSSHPNPPDAPPTGWTYAWDFDDDGTTDSTARNPVHDFGTDPSSSTVRLTVTDDDGLSSDVAKTLRWPLADFSFSPEAPFETDTVQFADQSSDLDGSIAAWDWSCTDGFTSSHQNPSHRFADGGTYTCELTVTDDDTLTDEEEKSLTVAHVAPVADFDHEVVNPGEVQLTDTSTHPNPADAPPTGWTYAWDFEDDGIFDSSQRNPFHDYGVDEGTFTVRLRVTDDDGQVDEVTRDIDVGIVNELPTADFELLCPTGQSGCFMPIVDEESTFRDLSSDADGQITEIEVDWEDTGVFELCAQGPDVAGSECTHTFTEHDDFPVTWRVTDDRGAVAEETKVFHTCEPPGHPVMGPGLQVGAHLCA